MAEQDYLTYDPAENPPFREREADGTLPPEALPLADATDPGAMSAAQFTKLAGIEAGATADQVAADVPFTPTGTIAATNVQDAIAEVAAEAGSGSGNVTGPGSSTDNQVARFSGVGGDAIKTSPVSISDAGAVSGVASIAVSGTVDGRDVSVDGTAQDAHIAAAAPHSGHATLVSGTVPLAQIPVLGSAQLGTDSVGSAQIAGNAVGTAEIGNAQVTLAKLAAIAASKLLGSIAGGTPAELTAAEVRAILNVEDGAQSGKAETLAGSGGATVLGGVAVDGTIQFRKINAGLSSTTIDVSVSGDVVQIKVANNGITTAQLASDSVGYPQLKNLSGPVFMGRVSATSGDPESITPPAALGMLGVEAGAIAPPYENADLATMPEGTVKGRLIRTGTGAVFDLLPREQRRNINVEQGSGARAFRSPFRARPLSGRRIKTLRRNGTWTAGVAVLDQLLDTHGTLGHLGPFMTFSAIDASGHPHMDHDRLDSVGGPDLVTNVEAQVLTAGLARFIFPAAGSWATEGYQAGKQIHAAGFTNAPTNGYFVIDDVSGSNLDVIDHNDVITAEAAAAEQEIRGTNNQSSGFNGYLEGLYIPADALRVEESFQFYGAGFMANTLEPDCFVEFCLEPNPVAGTYNGANRVRMLTGEVGATWTGTLPFFWDCKVVRGYDDDEYLVEWRLRILGLLDEFGAEHVEGGHDWTTEAVWSPRFRVGRISELDTYGWTNQGAGVSLTMKRYEAGA